MRRIALTTLLSVVVLLLGALPAAADVTATIRSPSAGQEITSSTAAQVQIQRQVVDRSVQNVELRLVRDGSPTSPAALTCVQGCGGTDQTWGNLAIDPRSPDEFGVSHPLANGTWTVQTRWQDGGDTWSAWGGDVTVTLSVPPSPVRDLAASAEQLEVTLTWTRAPEPDISAYRIQRRPDGGSWQVISSVGSSASSYQDTTPSAGAYEYRVVTVRPDGHGSVLTATSSATSVETTSAAEPSPSPSTSDGTSSDGGTSSGETSDDGSTSDDSSPSDDPSDDPSDNPSASPSDGSTSADGTAASGDDDGNSTSTRSSGRSRVAPPPGVRQGASFDLDARLPEPEVAPREEERFYGEGEGFSEELDYGGAQPIAPGEDGDVDDRTALQRIPGGVQEFIVSRFETRTLLRSIAAGLLFVVLGLHTYRWMHATPHD